MGPSFRQLAILISLIASAAVAAHAQARNSSIYAEIAGRADAVADFKKDAIARGWKVVCEQAIGPILTLRVRIPGGTPEAVLENYGGDIRDMRPYSVGFIYPGMSTSAPFCAPPANAQRWLQHVRLHPM